MMKSNQKMQRFVRSLCEESLIKMNLQLFAEDGEGDDDGSNGEGDDKVISFKNQSELDTWYDKKLSKSLETAKAAWAKEEEERVKTVKTEAERLAALSAEEKAQEQERLKKEEEEKRLAEITRRELRLEALEILEDKELPKELIDAVVLTDTDACKASIDGMEKAFRAAVESAVNKRLAASADEPAGQHSRNSKESLGSRAAKAANERTVSKTDLWGQK
ncbi:TPA: DUF4355 domain-containing protein [Enterococcus faecalis]